MKKNQATRKFLKGLSFKNRLYWEYLNIKKLVKKIRINREKLLINFFIGIAFLSIVIGLTIFISFLVKLSNEYTISGKHILIAETGQVGDFIGGVVGAVWSLTGVLLFYATLRLQSRELSENRKHFQISRLTDIVYKQLDFFIEHLNNFQLKDVNKDKDGFHIVYKGRAAVRLLKNRMESILELRNQKEEDADHKAMTNFWAKNFAFIELNKSEFENIFTELSNQVNVIRTILIKDEIPPIDLNELKTLFFRNVGDDFLLAAEMLGHYIEGYIEFKKKLGMDDEDLSDIFTAEQVIKSKIGVISEFRRKIYDKNTIQDYLENREMYNASYF